MAAARKKKPAARPSARMTTLPDAPLLHRPMATPVVRYRASGGGQLTIVDGDAREIALPASPEYLPLLATEIMDAFFPKPGSDYGNSYYFKRSPLSARSYMPLALKLAPRLAFEVLPDLMKKGEWSIRVEDMRRWMDRRRRMRDTDVAYCYLRSPMFVERADQAGTPRNVAYPSLPLCPSRPVSISKRDLFVDAPGSEPSGRRTALVDQYACHLKDAEARQELAAQMLNRLVPPGFDGQPAVFVLSGVISHTAAVHAERFARQFLEPVRDRSVGARFDTWVQWPYAQIAQWVVQAAAENHKPQKPKADAKAFALTPA